MADIEDRVRDLLEHRASDVEPRPSVPPSLARRVRRRLAAYAAIGSVVVVVLVGGAAAALRDVPGAPVVQPGESGASISACAADQLAASATVEGAAGTREGAIAVRNISDSACLVRGAPEVSLADADGTALTSGIDFATEPPTSGEIQLEARDTVYVAFRWSNWCAGVDPIQWRLVAPGGGLVDVRGLGSDLPPCNGPGMPSTVELRPYSTRAG
jgi:hypothetical protein